MPTRKSNPSSHPPDNDRANESGLVYCFAIASCVAGVIKPAFTSPLILMARFSETSPTSTVFTGSAGLVCESAFVFAFSIAAVMAFSSESSGKPNNFANFFLSIVTSPKDKLNSLKPFSPGITGLAQSATC